jgi:hypothetical protein
MTATLKTTIIQEPSSATANMTLGTTGGVTFGAAATTNTITSAAATNLTIQSAGTTAMTIDTSGNLLVGTTSFSISPSQGYTFYNATNSTLNIGHANGVGSGQNYMIFAYNSNSIGGITQNGTTGVSYNTSSDYRLKENVAPMTTGLVTISALNPVTYDWISDKSQGEGFIAHELAKYIPHAVTGEKDAVNEDGSIKPQGVDYSKIVVHLVAAVQEQQAMITALTARITALEVKP